MPVTARHRARPGRGRQPRRQTGAAPGQQAGAAPDRARRLALGAAAARHLTATMPWGVLMASCAIGLGISLAARRFADPFQQPASITLTVRAAFVPVVAGVAVLGSDPHRILVTSLPSPAWLTTAVRVGLALPLLGLTAWGQLQLAGAELAASLRSAGLAAGPLPRAVLGTELAAWLAMALSAAALVARTRWADLGGAIAAPAGLAVIALLAMPPLRLLPAAFTGLTGQHRSAWLHAEWCWPAIGLIALITACWATRDPWLRLRPPGRR